MSFLDDKPVSQGECRLKTLTALFAISPHIIGPAPVIKTDREQGFHNLAYIEAMGLRPFDIGDDLAERAYMEREYWKMGIVR